MAEVLRKFDFSGQSGSRGKYPWKEWTDGKIYRATQGKDFTVSITNFRSVLYGRALKQSMSVRSQLVGPDAIVFQFVPKEK